MESILLESINDTVNNFNRTSEVLCSKFVGAYMATLQPLTKRDSPELYKLINRLSVGSLHEVMNKLILEAYHSSEAFEKDFNNFNSEPEKFLTIKSKNFSTNKKSTDDVENLLFDFHLVLGNKYLDNLFYILR